MTDVNISMCRFRSSPLSSNYSPLDLVFHFHRHVPAALSIARVVLVATR